MDEEGKVSKGKAAMVLESLRVPNVAGVDIEDVDHDGTLNHVDNGEGQGG